MTENEERQKKPQEIPPRVIGPRPEPSLIKSLDEGWRARAISGALAGFSVAFIALLLTRTVADISIGFVPVTFGEASVLFFGIAAALFVGAAEFLMHAMAFDVYSLPPRYYDLYVQSIDSTKLKEFEKRQTGSLHYNENIARGLYNVAIFLVFIGLGFAMWPYNNAIATIVTGFGIVIEAIQMIRIRRQPGQP